MSSIILVKYGKRSSAFTLSPGCGWGVNERVNVTHLSPLCLRHTLQVVTRTAAILQQVRKRASRAPSCFAYTYIHSLSFSHTHMHRYASFARDERTLPTVSCVPS